MGKPIRKKLRIVFSLFSCIFMPHAEIERQPQTEWKKQLRTYQTSISSISAKTNFHGLMPQTCISLEKTWCELCFSMDFMVSEAPNLHSLGKTNSHLGAHCVFPWFHGLRSPKPAFIWKKPIFAPGCELCFLMDFGVITQTPNLHSLWEKPIGNLVGGWGGGVACSAFLTTSNEPQTDLNMT